MEPFDDTVEIATAKLNVLAQDLQDLWFCIVVPDCQKTPAWVIFSRAGADMEIISAVARLSSASGYECTEMGLVWKAVLRETHVLVDTVRAVIHSYSLDCAVE